MSRESAPGRWDLPAGADAFYVGPDCGYPDFMKIGMLVYQLSMIVLFSQFYSKSYKAAADAKKAKSK